MSEHVSGKIRLQKFLAEAGVAARRAAEDLVLEGRVKINGRVVDGLPAFVDPQEDDVRVDGDRVQPASKVYYLLNKPKGAVVTNYDPAGRKRVGDLLAGVEVRIFPVGRLEMDTDGVLLMTNDGELVEKLTHPRHGIEKMFRVEVTGQVSPEDLLKIRKGMWLSEGRTPNARVVVTYSSREMTILEITMRESKHRAIPRMLARLGHKVKKLTCIRIGRLTVRGMRAGEFRALTADEVKQLYKMAERSHEAAEARLEDGPRPPSSRPTRSRPAGRPIRKGQKPAERSAEERPAGKGGRPGQKPAGKPSRSGQRPAGKRNLPSGERPRRGRAR